MTTFERPVQRRSKGMTKMQSHTHVSRFDAILPSIDHTLYIYRLVKELRCLKQLLPSQTLSTTE